MAFWSALFRAMGTSRTRRIGRREAEQLLSGAPIVSADRETLIRLLNLAGAPPRPEEQVGQEVAVQAFIRARQERARRTGTRRVKPLALITRALVVKALTGAVVLLLGGVALAAGTGSLPPPVQQGAHDLLSPLGVAVPAGKTASPSGSSGHSPSPTPTRDPTRSPGPLPTPPGIQGLCQAWQASLRAGVGKSVDPASVKKLAEAAGGPAKIASYCATILGQPPPSDPAASSGGPDKSAKAKPSPPAPRPSRSSNKRAAPHLTQQP